jgi:hypothetical protein
MVLSLTDTQTGEVQTVEESNMVTEAVNDILGLNPCGVYFDAGGSNDMQVEWSDNLLPVCPNMIGGILMFSKKLAEDAGNLYPGSDNLPVAYASNDVNTTTNLLRGSLNATESKVIDNGYRFVWEFTPSQGNGTIAAVGLTSAKGGANAYGSAADDGTAFLKINKLDIGGLSDDEQSKYFHAVEVDFENNLLYAIRFTGGTVTVYKYRYPVFNIGLTERLDDSTATLLETQVIYCETFKFYGSYTPYGRFYDGKDGYWYGVANQSNSTGDAEILWLKISKADYSFTEGKITLDSVQLQSVGSMKMGNTYPEMITQSVMRNGYVYIMKYEKTGVYKININNPADVTFIPFGFTSAFKPLGGTGSCACYMQMIGDLVIGYDFQIDVNDKVIRTAGTVRFESIATPLFQYKQFLIGWGGSYGSEYRLMYLLTPYLATINNLSSAVVKDAGKTMKVTYELTEVDDGKGEVV